MAITNSHEVFLVCLVTLFALIGLFHVLRGAIRWLRAWDGPKGPLGIIGLVWGIIAVPIAGMIFLGPPLMYYFVTYVGRPLGAWIEVWWRYWHL